MYTNGHSQEDTGSNVYISHKIAMQCKIMTRPAVLVHTHWDKIQHTFHKQLQDSNLCATQNALLQ